MDGGPVVLEVVAIFVFVFFVVVACSGGLTHNKQPLEKLSKSQGLINTVPVKRK